MDLQSAKARGKKWLTRAGLALILVPPPLIALYIFAALKFSYADGERVGYVQKLSKRGWLCKTYEGELAQVQMPGQPATMFPFTVRSDDVGKKVEELHGHRVVLEYEQKKGLPSTCFGDTEYFVVGVRKAE